MRFSVLLTPEAVEVPQAAAEQRQGAPSPEGLGKGEPGVEAPCSALPRSPLASFCFVKEKGGETGGADLLGAALV